MKYFVSMLTLSLFLSGCVGLGIRPKPEVTRWNKENFTVCCERKESQLDCVQEDWVTVIRQHCPGRAKSIEGSKEKKVTGARMTEDKDPSYYGEETKTVEIDQKTSQVQCVTYVCSSPVRP